MAIVIRKRRINSSTKPDALVSQPCNPFPEIADPLGHGQRAVDFLRSLKHPKSRLPGQAFQLDPWQERIVRQIYGPRDEHGNRIINDVTILVPRGNRKTSLGAALSLLHTLGPEAIPGTEVLFAAKDQTQAGIAWREVRDIVRAGGILWQKGQGNRRFDAADMVRLQEYLNRILFPNESYIEALSSDAEAAHGRTPMFALCDEIHAWPKRAIWDVIDTGLTKTPGSLRVTITTAGRGQQNLGHEIIDHARKVQSGAIGEPNHLVVLYEPPADADWQDEAVWRAVNPGLEHGYPDIIRMRQAARKAQLVPANQAAFKMYNLNMWLDGSSDPFVEMAVYDQGAKPFDLSDLAGQPCCLGIDLSTNRDLTVIVAAWQDGNDGYIVHPWFFCPADNLHQRAERDGVPYPLWAEQGFIEPTPGNVVDYRHVENTVRDLCGQFDVREIAFDPHMAQQTLNNLLEDSLPVVIMPQASKTMCAAINELERAIIGGKFQHGGHPVLRWNFDNIAVEINKYGGKSFHKGKSRDRIDGAVAAAMAVARAAAGEGTVKSLYASDDWADAAVF